MKNPSWNVVLGVINPCNKLERIQRLIFWGGDSSNRKIHLVKLGTMLGEIRWLWRFAEERNNLC